MDEDVDTAEFLPYGSRNRRAAFCRGNVRRNEFGFADLFGTFARVFARIEADGEPTPLLNNTLRGWTRLPVIVTPS